MASDEEKGFNLPEAEEKILKFWEENKIFEKSLKKTAKKKPFAFYDGPPFATGLPHYGHILASTIKDVIPRYQTMRGRFVRRRWGWDCHGLPIEEIVERKLGISGKKQIEEIGIKKFNETCRGMVLEYAAEWKKMIRRIARWAEFDDSYKTMDADYMESVWWAFKEIHKKGLVYEGRKVLLYCPRCETPVSNFEVAMDNSYKEVTEESVVVKFKVKTGQKIGNWPVPENTYILSWTTTPWTLPGNVALAVGCNIEYMALPRKVDDRKEFFIVAKSIYEKPASPFQNEADFDKAPASYLPEGAFKGKSLVGLEYEPLFDVPAAKSDKAFKIYAADFVNTDEGTGIVHTAVVYGEDDYNLGAKVGLPVVPLLDEKGKFNKHAPKFLRGIYFKEAEKIIKKDLDGRKLLFRREMHQHSYPYCWRCGNVLFYNAIPAWFVNIQKIKPKLLKSNAREINWFPKHLKHGRYEKSVEQAPDWNISRNRYWGNPIPVWRCDRCHREEVIGGLEELSARAGAAKNNYWVMRHGESEANIFNLIEPGLKGFDLTPRGRSMARKSFEEFEKKLAKTKQKIDLIVASPITRTRETAEIDEKIAGLHKIIFDDRLREIQLGPTLAGCHDSKYHELYPTYESKFEKQPEEGESLRDLRKRMWEFIRDAEKKHSGKNILIVSHEYPIWMLSHAACAWSEKQAIAEKMKRGDDFIKVAAIEKLDFKTAPRDDTGLVDLHRPYIDEIALVCGCGGTMRRTPEIFDSWMEAGSMPFAECHYPFENKKLFEGRFPAQFVAEYIAQTRAWFYVMHVVSFILFGGAPFENVVTTGTILAEDGSKMSKSKENFPDPRIVIDKYGADALRLYLMNSVVMQADNLNFSERGVETLYRKVNLLLWNVYKYFVTYIGEKKDDGDSRPNVLDLWIETRTAELVEKVTGYLDLYDTVRATRVIQEYVDDLSTWYLRRSRRRKDQAFFQTMRECLLTTSKIIAPFMPFLAEELHLGLAPADAPKSVHLCDWPRQATSDKRQATRIIDDVAETRRLASVALAERAKAGIKVRQPLSMLKVKSKKLKISGELLAVLADEVNVKEVVFDQKIKGEVELDLKITPELREEGTLRELVRTIQGLRQEAGLRPKDKIVLMLELPDLLREIAMRNEAFFKREVGADAMEYKKDKFGAEINTKIENQNCWLALRKK